MFENNIIMPATAQGIADFVAIITSSPTPKRPVVFIKPHCNPGDEPDKYEYKTSTGVFLVEIWIHPDNHDDFQQELKDYTTVVVTASNAS